MLHFLFFSYFILSCYIFVRPYQESQEFRKCKRIKNYAFIDVLRMAPIAEESFSNVWWFHSEYATRPGISIFLSGTDSTGRQIAQNRLRLNSSPCLLGQWVFTIISQHPDARDFIFTERFRRTRASLQINHHRLASAACRININTRLSSPFQPRFSIFFFFFLIRCLSPRSLTLCFVLPVHSWLNREGAKKHRRKKVDQRVRKREKHRLEGTW